ncbi:hypothetical protein [Maricaulis sp.]|uniref:hypothetical protein n=1 Tax=Maricaulis sp. TaxID=1486257 RepID=UPI003A8E3367
MFQLDFIEELDRGSNGSQPTGMEFVAADILRLGVGGRTANTSMPADQSARSAQSGPFVQPDLFSQDWNQTPLEMNHQDSTYGSGDAPQSGAPASLVDLIETISFDGGVNGLADNAPLFDFSAYLERHERQLDALSRIADLELPAGDGATVTDTNGITVPLSFLLEHLEDGFGQNEARLPDADGGSPEVDSGILNAMSELADGGAPFNFDGYLEISEQCIATLGRADGLGKLAADVTGAMPDDAYAVQLALLLEQVDQHPGAPDLASLADHHSGEIPSAAEITGLDWLSPEVVDTFGFDYSLF